MMAQKNMRGSYFRRHHDDGCSATLSRSNEERYAVKKSVINF
jgi:hypothetical protein